MEQQYIRRIADKLLEQKLSASGAVLIEGPKWCGKTRTAKEKAKSKIEMQDPDNAENYQRIAKIKPTELLRGESPRLIDEWQVAPILWDAVRYEVDKNSGKLGQFILTGSAVPNDEEIMHSGVGRISRLKMYPMSLFESLESTGDVSLGELFEKEDIDISGKSNLSLDDVVFAIHRGGWPSAVTMKDRASAINLSTEYIEQVIESDISRVDNIEKNPDRVRSLLRSYARNISTLSSLKTIQDDIMATSSGLSDHTISQYLNALSRIFVIRDIPAWQPSLRSKTAIRTTPKRQFIDPSLATAIMRLSPSRFFEELKYYGFLFESLVERDLRIYIEANDGNLYHYRDADGLEIDSIVQLNDGRWGAIEIKLGIDEVDDAASNLLKLKEKVSIRSAPAFLAVIVGNEQIAYRREDGVCVIPIGCLKP